MDTRETQSSMAMFHKLKPQFRIRNTSVSRYLSQTWVSPSMQAAVVGQQTFILSVPETGRAKIQALADVTAAEGPLSGYCLLVFARGREDAQVSLPFLIRELRQGITFLPSERHDWDSHILKPSSRRSHILNWDAELIGSVSFCPSDSQFHVFLVCKNVFPTPTVSKSSSRLSSNCDVHQTRVRLGTHAEINFFPAVYFLPAVHADKLCSPERQRQRRPRPCLLSKYGETGK